MLPTLLLLLAAVMDQSGTTTGRPHSGVVRGVVTYEDGKVAGGATVYASPMDTPIMGIIPHTDTDESGQFSLQLLSWGRYHISASKEDEAYPKILIEFFARNHPNQQITLSPDSPTAMVTIRLGPKAAILTGTVKDAATSAPLNPCAQFLWASDTRNFMTGTGLVNATFHVLVPSDTELLWKVWLDGYKPWYYPGTTDNSAATSLRLGPGQSKTFTIELQPDSTAEPVGCGMPVGTVIPKE